MKIIKSLKIEATQADVETAIKRMVHEQDPTIVVDEIQFTQKRNGKDSISVKIDAHFGDVNEVQAEEKQSPPKGESTISDHVDEPTEEDSCPFEVSEPPKGDGPEKEETPEVSPKKSLFG